MADNLFEGNARQKKNPFNIPVLQIDNVTALLATMTGIVSIGALLYLAKGDLRMVAAVIIPLWVVGLSIYRLDYGFLILFACVLFFDQFLVVDFRPFTYYADFFRNFKEISYLPSHPAGVINPVELYLLLLCGVAMLVISIRKTIRVQAIPAWPALLFFLFWLFFALFNGLTNGGEMMVALWEIRALIYLSTMYILVPQIIQTRSQVRAVVWIIIAALFFKACQGIYRFASVGFSTGGIQTFTNHEDPVFFSTLFILLLAMLFLKFRDRQRTVLLLLAIPLLLGFYLSLRRAAFAGLCVSLPTLFLLLGREERKRYLHFAIPGFVLLLVYTAAFWNSESRVAQPVQMIKSGIVKQQKNENPDDYYSNLYRDYENYNLASTVKRKPIFGIGFGNKYDESIDDDIFRVVFPLKEYIPHNQILWWLVKTGVIGFFCFWLFFNAFVLRGASVYSRIKDPYLKAICAMAVVAVINQMVVSYFDLQLTYYRNMIYLGTLMGLLPTIERLGGRNNGTT